MSLHRSLSKETQPPILDSSPAVSMDIRLGDKFYDISFDYEAFEREAERMGMSESHSGSYSISLTPRNFSSLDAGSHNGAGSYIDVGIGDWSSEKRVNKILRHELQHAADYEANGKSYGSNARYSLSTYLGKPMLGFVAYDGFKGIKTAFGEDFDGLMTEYYMDISSYPRLALLAFVALYLWSYTFHPREKSARRAARSGGDDIIQFWQY